MKQTLTVFLVLITGTLLAQNVQSPSKTISLDFSLADGKPSYSVNYKNKPVILQSLMGVKLKETTDLASGFSIDNVQSTSFNESWKPVLGEQSDIVNHYNQLTVALVQASGRKLNIIFRVFDEGIAFRYDFPRQKDL